MNLALGVVRDGEQYATLDDRFTVGFVPGGECVMLDAHGLGLVSAVPYRHGVLPP